MKILIILLLPLLSFGQWTESEQMQTGWFIYNSSYGYFSGYKNSGEITLKVYECQNKLIQPFVFVIGSKGSFSTTIVGKTRNGFYMSKIYHYEAEKILSAHFVTSVEIIVLTEKNEPKTISIPIDKYVKNELLTLIQYTKPL